MKNCFHSIQIMRALFQEKPNIVVTPKLNSFLAESLLTDNNLTAAGFDLEEIMTPANLL